MGGVLGGPGDCRAPEGGRSGGPGGLNGPGGISGGLNDYGGGPIGCMGPGGGLGGLTIPSGPVGATINKIAYNLQMAQVRIS